MKNAFIKLWNFHGFIGKILTFVCLALVLSGLIGLITGVTKCSSTDEVVATNYFVNEDVPLHDENYSVTVAKCWTSETIETIGKDLNTNNLNGNFINIELSINQSENSSLKPHILDSNDFKLKDHTGFIFL